MLYVLPISIDFPTTFYTFLFIKQSQYMLSIGDQICINYDRRVYYNVTCGTVTLNDTTKSIYVINYLHQNVSIENLIVSWQCIWIS